MALSIGTATAALGGPLTHLLLLTGRESTYIRVLAVGTLARYAGIVCFGWFAGLAGAAIANAVAMVLVTLVLTVLCRRLVGVDPSILVLASPLAGEVSSDSRHIPQAAE
jgi:O-antigen/teichoic acid export membrane protein